MLICIILYIVFMVSVDIPMYIKRAMKPSNKYNNFSDGLNELMVCKKSTFLYNEWKEDIPLMSFYFTFALWGSIYMLKCYEKYSKIKRLGQ